jgi:replicative DNA helicase
MAKDRLLVPPQDIDMERALLGALLLNPNAVYEIVDLIGIDSFYAGKHRTVFDAMLSLHAKGEPIDVVTVSGKLKERKQLADVGGAAYLSELTASAASPGSARHYAQNVQNKFVLRSLLDAAAKIGELGFQEDRDIEQVLDEAQSAIFHVSNSPTLQSFTAIKDELAEAWERLEQLQKHKGAMRGIPTGFKQLDDMLSGLQKSDLVILAARPSMGKTTLALDIARQTATKHKTSVGIFSLEMSSQQLVDRMLAAQAGVNSWRLRTGKISRDDEYDRLQEGIAALSEAPIYIDDKPGMTVLSMRSVARRLKMERDLGLVVIDYLQLITPTSAKSNESLVQQVTEISRSLKAMARELDVPVLALSQLSRAVEQRRGKPRLSDLRDSGSIEQDADVVMFIHREDKMNSDVGAEKTNIAEILIEKHRNGPVGAVTMRFDEEKTTFLPVEKSNFGDFVHETQVGGESAPF